MRPHPHLLGFVHRCLGERLGTLEALLELSFQAFGVLFLAI